MDLIVRNALIRGQSKTQDIGITDGRIAAIADRIGEQGAQEIDAGGRLTTPPFVDAHVHLDKSQLRDVMRPNLSGTLQEAVEITCEHKRGYTPEDIKSRAGKAIETAIKNGTLYTRIFCDVGTVGGNKPVEGMLYTRKFYQHLAHLEVVAFPQEGIIRDPGAEKLLWEAMEMGADIVGGLPWYEYTDEDARKHIDVCFAIAKHYDKDIAMLVDDTDDANSRSLEYLAYKTMQEGYQGRVTASHCGALAFYNNTYAAKVVAMVAQAGITISSNPHISLYAMGLRFPQPIPRGVTRVKELQAAGVNVCSSQDDVNDPYYPFGRPDQLEVAFIACHVLHYWLEPELETAFDMITTRGAKALRIKDYGLAVGNPANLVVVDCQTVQQALRWRPPRSYVIYNGRLVARSQLTSELFA